MYCEIKISSPNVSKLIDMLYYLLHLDKEFWIELIYLHVFSVKSNLILSVICDCEVTYNILLIEASSLKFEIQWYKKKLLSFVFK